MVKCLSEEKLVEVGRVTHFYLKISVAIVELKASLNIGDKILIKGATTNFEQTVESMQIEHKNIERAEACLLYTSPSPRDAHESRMPSSA